MITQYLNILGLPTDKPFHCVNPNHKDRTPSMSFNSKDSQHVHCFGCHANWDLFDLIAVNELDAPVIDDANVEPKVQYRFSDAYNRAIQVLGVNVKPIAHGKEFANYQTIEQLTGTQVYFAHAYSPHERGSNENRNRVLRRFIPKGQAIEELSDRQLVQINWYLNSRPLKCLNWHTPIEIFLLNLRH